MIADTLRVPPFAVGAEAEARTARRCVWDVLTWLGPYTTPSGTPFDSGNYPGALKKAMAGIGMSLGVMMAYEGSGTLFEKMGDVALLPPALAAWSPDALFALTGLYLLLRMRS